MRLHLLFLLTGILACQAGDDFALIRAGDAWHYRKGTNEPPAGWQNPGFDDRAWPEGPTGFGFLGYCATFLDYTGPSYASIYYKRAFEAARLDSIEWLILRLDYLDGFVAFLNGTEVCRRGFPGPDGSFVPYSAVPSARSSGVPEEIDLSDFKHLLRAGSNVLAIQSHMTYPYQYSYTLAPELLVNFTRGPFLQNLSSNAVQVIWKTPYPSDTRVQYSSSGATLGFLDTNLTQLHVASLSGLTPDAQYTYTVSSSRPGQTAASPPAHFRTFRPEGPLVFSVIGDTGYGSLGQLQVASVLRRTQPDLVVHLGDVLYPSYNKNIIDLRCFSIYQPQMKDVPFFMTVGNHDLMENTNAYLEDFYLPANNPAYSEYYYSFDQGDAHFVILNAILSPPVGDYSPGSPQLLWLEQDLAQTRKPWKFLFFHTPPRSSGPHRIDDYNANRILDSVEMDQTIGELARRQGVQVIFAAHDHAYERLRPVGGVYTMVSGGGGAILYTSTAYCDEASAQRYARYNCLKVEVNREGLRLSALGADNQVFDELNLRRVPAPPPTSPAARHSPVIENSPANDGDGNIAGQAFDLAGDPIQGLMGRDAHPGDLYVNYDDQRLYLGLSGVMLATNQNLLLFLGSAGKAGVSQLADLSSFPEDCSWMRLNLSFPGWAPSVVGVFGDEFQDGQYGTVLRSLSSPGNRQGVFFLEKGFPPVPEVQLQQFNRSPQVEPVVGESRADYIELSIPRHQLGLMHPGELVQVGVVVVTNYLATSSETNLPLQLDPGFIGAALNSTAPGRFQLEGISVQLGELDSDEDGFLDRQELVAGTDPHDPHSLLKVEIQTLSGDQLQIRWQSVPGRKYQVEGASNLSGEFQAVQHPSLPRLATSLFEDLLLPPLNSSNQFRFYRIRLIE